jgi:predicted small lipoprotein YifL
MRIKTPLALLLVSVSLGLAACGDKGPPEPKTPKEAAMAYVEAIKTRRCARALELTGGVVRSTYEKQIANTDLENACATWQVNFALADKVEYGYEEKKPEGTIVWLRVSQNSISVEGERLIIGEVDGKLRIIGN